MAYIESHQALRDHPKTKRVARVLGQDIPRVVGLLTCLWWWAMDYAPDGSLKGYEVADIAEGAMWTGDPQEFVDALLKAGGPEKEGFLEKSDGHLWIHDWDQYGGKLQAKKDKNAEANRAYRDRKRRESLDQTNEHRDDNAKYRDNHEIITTTSRDELEERREEERRGEEIHAHHAHAHLAPNGTSEATAPDGAAVAEAPALSAPKGIVAEFDERLNSEPNKPAVLEDAHVRLFARHAKHGRLGAMAKRHGYGVVLRKMVIAAASWNGVDDPLDYTQKIISGKSGPGPPSGTANGYEPHYLSGDEARKKQEEDEAWTAKYLNSS